MPDYKTKSPPGRNAGGLFALAMVVAHFHASMGEVETHFSRRARNMAFSSQQLSLIIGSLLGDGYLMRTTAGYCLRVHHGQHQAAYVAWKYGWLRDFVRTPPKQSASAYYFRTVTHPHLTSLGERFYPHGHKILPFDLITETFDALSLAVWVMDDGGRDGNQLRINTQSFSTEENLFMADLLVNRFNIACTLNYDKGKPRLRIRCASMATLRAVIQPYLLPGFRYKLP